MATTNSIESDKELEQLKKEQALLLENKRKATDNTNWLPLEGAGMIPENEWKKYNPDSNTDTAV